MPNHDRRLNWVPRHDARSRDYPLRAVVGAVEDKPRRWQTGSVLDQGREGACVGFGWTAELMASPRPDPYTTSEVGNAYARELYRRAQQIDEWAGESYEGTSVLAGAKAVVERGHIGEYRWAFGIDDVRDAVIAAGPVVVGVPWLSGMYDTRASGLVEVEGDIVGGHCLLVTGYHPGIRLRHEDWHARYRGFRWRNSWGLSYGVNGDGFVRYEDLRDLLTSGRGEACAPVERKTVRLSPGA